MKRELALPLFRCHPEAARPYLNLRLKPTMSMGARQCFILIKLNAIAVTSYWR
jgi:hypothetical protein